MKYQASYVKKFRIFCTLGTVPQRAGDIAEDCGISKTLVVETLANYLGSGVIYATETNGSGRQRYATYRLSKPLYDALGPLLRSFAAAGGLDDDITITDEMVQSFHAITRRKNEGHHDEDCEERELGSDGTGCSRTDSISEIDLSKT